MFRFNVEVLVPGNPRFSVEVEAADRFKAQTKAMAVYPHQLRGQTVDYLVEALVPPIDFTDRRSPRAKLRVVRAGRNA